ncbi:EthD family reductase [Labrenzia sp. PHM005]|uniref:EthD family reductase n=1 Tax=Labrenzia sp. PHM005 TaxID=2590016 RepID=UPI0011401BCD|nr:EthD family reductase [Labrenzia sp. PHM005]QDG78462.1 EthD family reductase [Labrenzia sp. PHM005]
MAVSLQVLYPVGPETRFDYDYYAKTHMALVAEHMGPHAVSVQAVKGLAGGPDTPPEFYAVATMIFENQEKLQAASAAAGPVTADIPNYTNTKPQLLIGEVIG